MSKENGILVFVYLILIPVLVLLSWWSDAFLKVIFVSGFVGVIGYGLWDMVWGDAVGGF